MTFIKTIPENEAEGPVQELYQQQKGSKDFLPNYARVFCYRPGVMDAWAKLQKEIRSTMDFRNYELIVLAAAQELNNSYCSLAHGKVLTDNYYTTRQLEDIVGNRDTNSLSSKEKAMMELARKVVRNTATITAEDIEQVRHHGFTEEEIFDIVTAAAARCFFAKIPDALGVKPDHAYSDFPQSLQNVLVVGREIEGANRAD